MTRVFLLLAALTTGCTFIPNEKVSMEEAQQLSFELSKIATRPPKRNIEDIKYEFGEPYKLMHRNCEEKQAKAKAKWDLAFERYSVVTTNRGGWSIANRLAQKGFLRGDFTGAISNIKKLFAKTKNQENAHLPAATLAASLARMHLKLGDIDEAEDWISVSRAKLGQINNARVGDYTRLYKRVLILSLNSISAQIDKNLVLEEYYLRRLVFLFNWYMQESAGLSLQPIVARLALNLMAQNKSVESEKVLRENMSLTADLIGGDISLLMAIFAEAVLAQGRTEDAEYLARLAVTMHHNNCSVEDDIPYTEARVTLLRILSRKNDWRGVLELERELKNALRDKPFRFKQLFSTNPDLLLAKILSGKTDGSFIGRVRQAYSRSQERNGPENLDSLQLGAVLAMALESKGDFVGAFSLYNQVVPQLQKLQLQNVNGSGRYLLFRDRYIAFLVSSSGGSAARESGENPSEISFALANSSNHGELQHQVSIAALKATVPDPELASAIRELQNYDQQSKDLLETIVFLQSSQAGQIDVNKLKELGQQQNLLRQAATQQEQEIRESYPDYAEMLNPVAPEVPQIQALLRPSELMLVFHFDDDRGYLWSLNSNSRLTAQTLDINLTLLESSIDELRLSLDPGVDTLAEIPEFNTNLSYELYRWLLEPVLEHVSPKIKDLIVVTSGKLGTLPLGLLLTDPKGAPEQQPGKPIFSQYEQLPWLIKQYSVSVVPSAKSFLLLRQAKEIQKGSAPRFAGFGNPIFKGTQDHGSSIIRSRSAGKIALRASPDLGQIRSADLSSLPALPGTQDEVEEIGKILSAGPEDLFTGFDATEANVKNGQLATRDVLVFATHGLLPGDLNGLDQPALAFTNPSLLLNTAGSKASTNEDGILKMQEILGLELSADWVVLSACNTGADNGRGAEAFSGLGQAFFFAGARSLLLTNWPVESSSAKLLTTGLFKRQYGSPQLTRAQAMQQSIQSLISSNHKRGYFSYAHPIFWAPFTLVGEGG